MSWNTLSARDRSAFMNIALRHGVTDLAAIKRAYDSLGGDNVMADGGPAKTKEPPISLAQRAAENRRRKAHLFDGLDNLDRPNQMETVLDDLVAARDRYAQTNDISTSWEPVDLNDVSITDNGFVTREGRTGNSFVLPEARVYGRRTVVPEQTSTDDSFLDRFRAARNRVKYGHSTLTKEDRDMIQRGNKIAAAGSAAIAAGVATPYIASYASPILEMVQPSTITDAIAMRMGARVGSYPFAAKTYAGSLTGAGTASDAITEGLKYAYDRFRGDSPGSFGEDLETATSLAPLAVAPIIPGAQRIYGAARGIRRNMPNFRKVGRFIRSLPTSRGFTKYANDASDTFSESVPEFDKLGTATEWLGNVYAGLADWVMPDSVGNANSDEGNVRAHGGRLNRFDGLDNLDRPNQMEMAFDDLVAARDRYAQTGDIGTSWEPVDLNDVSITDNGFVTRQGRVGDSFVLPEATVIGQRPVVNEAIPEEEPDGDSFLGRLRAARNRVKYGHSKLTEEDKAMTRYANKIAAAGSGAIAAGIAAPYFAPYLASNVGTVLNAMQPSTYLDAIASGLGAQIGNYGLGASTMAGALGNAAMASGLTAEGLDYLYNTYLTGDNQRSFRDDLNASLALAPFIAAPAAGAKKLIDLSRNSGRLMTKLEHANRLTRYLSAPRRARRYLKDNRDYLEELKKRIDESMDESRHLEQLRRRLYSEDAARLQNLRTSEVSQIDLSKASKEDIQKYLDKHATLLESKGIPKDFIEFNENGEPIINILGTHIFESGKVEVPVFGTGETKAFNIMDVSHGGKENLRTGAIIDVDGKSYNASELADYYKLTRDNIKYVEKATGGKAFGSSAMVGFEGVPHATHDYDVLVTEEMADKKMPGWRDNFDGALAHYDLDGGKYGNIGNIDVNVIKQGPDGKAVGIRAMELFRQFFPEEYGKQAEAFMLNNLPELNIKITKTPQELLDAYDPVTKTVMDALEIDYKQYGKEKHAARILGYLAYSQNPKSVAKGIDNFAKMLVGKDYRPAPKLDFSDRETNIKFIDTMFGAAAGPLHRIADSPERMQSLFDMFYLGETTYVRELNTQLNPVSKAERDRVLNLWPHDGGISNGKLINAVKGNRSEHGDQIVVSQIPVELKDGMSIADAWKKISRAAGHSSYKFTADDLAADSRIGEYLGIDVGDDTRTALYKISNMSNKPLTKADDVLRDHERFEAITKDPFYSYRRPTDQRASIASDILKDNKIYGLENGELYIDGPYVSVVENLPYVSRQNLYWPFGKSFRSLTQRASQMRRHTPPEYDIGPMTVQGHNGKDRSIKSGIRAMKYEREYKEPEQYMPLARKKLRKEIKAANAKTRRLEKAEVKQDMHVYETHPLLGGKSLEKVERNLRTKNNKAKERAIAAAAMTPFAAFMGATAYRASKESEAKDEAFGQALRNLYGEDYYKNFSEDNPGADYNHFINEHKDEIDAEVRRLMLEYRRAKRKKKSEKK